jgi:ABC-2 type transport system ATP-binding protein
MAILEVTNLRKTYGSTVAVDDVSFSVEEGEVFGILGPNGAGKTTTVECVEGLRRRDGGDIRVLGHDPDQDHAALTRVVGVQLQESGLQDRIRVREALDLFSTFYDDPLPATELLRELQLAEVADTAYAKLSGGQKQRLSIALALLGRPRIAVLDELTAGLDPVGRRETWSLVERIRERGVTVLLVTHFMEEAERLCDRVAVIDHGRVVAVDSPAGLVDRLGGGGQVVRFRLADAVDPVVLTRLTEVRNLRTHDEAPGAPGTSYVVTGTDHVLQAVMTALTRAGALAYDVRLDRASLDDAFVALVREDQPDTEEVFS